MARRHNSMEPRSSRSSRRTAETRQATTATDDGATDRRRCTQIKPGDAPHIHAHQRLLVLRSPAPAGRSSICGPRCCPPCPATRPAGKRGGERLLGGVPTFPNEPNSSEVAAGERGCVQKVNVASVSRRHPWSREGVPAGTIMTIRGCLGDKTGRCAHLARGAWPQPGVRDRGPGDGRMRPGALTR